MVLDFSSFKWHKNSILAANQTSSSFNLMITYSQFYQRSVAISRSGTYLLSLFIDRFFLPLIFFFHVFVMPGKDGGKFCPLFYEFIICSNTYHSTLNKIVIWIYKSIFSSAIPNQRKIRLKLINTKNITRWLRIKHQCCLQHWSDAVEQTSVRTTILSADLRYCSWWVTKILVFPLNNSHIHLKQKTSAF